MNIEQLQFLVVDALEDIKAQDVTVFDTTHLSDMFERVIVASGTSNRQTRALAMHVRDKVKSAGEPVLSVEGEDTGEWLLVDLGPVVVHIMQPAIRTYYNLEELWGARPLTTKKPAKKAADKKRPAKKKTPASKKAPAKKSAQSTAAKSARKPPSKKAPAKKPATKKTAAKTTATTAATTTKTPRKKSA